MKDILSFLHKFKDLIRNKSFIEECCESVFKKLSLPITQKDVELVGSILHVKSRSGPLKAEIRLKKEIILKKIEEEVGERLVIDIK